ncbi:MAG TPA: hypothetical protein VMF30_18145 [Pirellulales bacterium]|nr:hypothetical protein [Pirellulales bacterium]
MSDEQTPNDPSPAEPQLYFGQATEAVCRVYAAGIDAEAFGGQSPGLLYGPESPCATTLRVRHPFVHRSDGAGVVEATIAEPCFWTPAAPYIYRYELHASPSAPATTGLFAIRRLQVLDDHLVFDRRRWVLRGALAEQAPDNAAGEMGLGRGDYAAPLAAWHETPLAAVVDRQSDALCELASRLGVLLVARVSPTRAVAELRRLARWPAVGIAILDGLPADFDPRPHARNMLFAEWVANDSPLRPAPWSQLLFGEVADPAAFARKIAGCSLPIVALRPCNDWSGPDVARTACDRLQRDLAAVGVQAAGYVV